MSSRHLFAAIPMACLLAVGGLGIAPMADAETVRPSAKSGKIAGSHLLEARRRYKRRFQSVKIHLPLGPTSIYYDYPYYYARGHYPTHIGGYVYYPYQSYRRYNASHFGHHRSLHRLRARSD
jgi:hypothetical protein